MTIGTCSSGTVPQFHPSTSRSCEQQHDPWQFRVVERENPGQ